MKELTEQEVLDKINVKEQFVLKVFMDNCSFCDKFAPVIEAASLKYKEIPFYSFKLPTNTAGKSEFKKLYMKTEAGERLSAPVTMLFADGSMKHRNFGYLNEEDLDIFLQTGDTPQMVNKKLKDELFAMYAEKGKLLTLGEKLPMINQRIVEIEKALEKRGVNANSR